jgi:hypothetical protein
MHINRILRLPKSTGSNMKKVLVFILNLLFSINLLGQTLPFQNPDLSSEERAKDLKTVTITIK